ncbi:MAG TPA: pectate lyase [Phycisphaerae bacterium]|nr:pectate lyase [Phycisphaerae bacterium]
MRRALPVAAALAAMLASTASADEAVLEPTRDAMAKATDYFTSISTNGGWAGIYSLDLKQRWGESLGEKAKATEIWVQPPGTPTVGKTLLRAFRATGDKRYLAAARNTGRALVWGQRTEGGWDHRVDVSHLAPGAKMPERRKGHCTFDDNISQGAIDFLMDLDETLDEPWLDDGVALGLKFLLRSQFPNGAWPQWYPLRGGYQDYYTFNDNTINDCIRVLLDAHRRYGKKEWLDGAKRGGNFIILSQVKAPQAGWAQQYSHDLKPAPARAFEPAAVCSATTARNIRTLVDLAVTTRDTKYLQPIPVALDWLDRSQLKDGVWARLYEVGTNRPIYGDRDGKVHYTLDEISEERRTGYSWQSGYGVASAKAYYERVRQIGPAVYANGRTAAPSPAGLAKRARGMESHVKKVVAALDSQGRWVDRDERIRCQTFVANMRVLCDYVEAASAR